MNTPYIYVFVRKDLTQPQQTVQASHACIEAAKAFLVDQEEHPHLVVIGVNNESKLYRAIQKLDQNSIRYKVFHESDRDDEATAVATEVIAGERRSIFKNYKLLGVA